MSDLTLRGTARVETFVEIIVAAAPVAQVVFGGPFKIGTAIERACEYRRRIYVDESMPLDGINKFLPIERSLNDLAMEFLDWVYERKPKPEWCILPE